MGTGSVVAMAGIELARQFLKQVDDALGPGFDPKGSVVLWVFATADGFVHLLPESVAVPEPFRVHGHELGQNGLGELDLLVLVHTIKIAGLGLGP